MRKKTIVYVVTIILSIIYLLVAGLIAVGDDGVFGQVQEEKTVKAEVLRVTDREKISYESDGESTTSMELIYFEAKALNGDVKGQTLYAVQELDLMFALRQPDVQAGDKVMLAYSPTDDGAADYYLTDFSRTGPLIALCAVFFVLLLIFGRKKGLDTIISLAFTCLAVFVTLIPAILDGKNVYFWSIITCVFITVMTLLIVNGANVKSLAAGVGCVGGVLASGLIVLIVRGSIKLTGMLDEEWVYLSTIKPNQTIDLKGIIFGMIIVGAVGAVMDVAMSIASSLQEIHEKTPTLPARELLKSGLTIGRDIMGTMANTLVLAYIGSSLASVLLLVTYSANVTQILNRELIAVEILQALAGSLGILFALPLTAVVSVFLLKRFVRK
ncbi:MAG: YibE/F family protein [Clostridia bacterium]|nr:YibE/F family protein [Clostridia bacterium]